MPQNNNQFRFFKNLTIPVVSTQDRKRDTDKERLLNRMYHVTGQSNNISVFVCEE